MNYMKKKKGCAATVGSVRTMAAVLLLGLLILIIAAAPVMAQADTEASGSVAEPDSVSTEAPVVDNNGAPVAPSADRSGAQPAAPPAPTADQPDTQPAAPPASTADKSDTQPAAPPAPTVDKSEVQPAAPPAPTADKSEVQPAAPPASTAGQSEAQPAAPQASTTDQSEVQPASTIPAALDQPELKSPLLLPPASRQRELKSPLPLVPVVNQPAANPARPLSPATNHTEEKLPATPAPAAGQAGETTARPRVAEIVVGGIFDFTGPTSMIGRDYAEGASAAAVYINNNGGVDGISLRLITGDYASRPSKAFGLYKTYTELDSAYVMLGWGTADARALQKKVTEDHVVYLSSAFDADLADPALAPYNFTIGSTYSDHARMAMGWAKENGGKKVCFIYPDHPYGIEPVEAGKEYAKKMGLITGPDIEVDLRATDVANQLLPLKEFNPEYAWIGGTSPSTEVILNDAARLKLKTKFIINTWGFDENLLKSAGAAANGRAMGFIQVRPFGYDVPETAHIKSVVGDNNYNLHFNQAWAAMMVIWEGLERAVKDNNLNGPGLKAAIETLRDFETGGLTPPLTYTSEDHRGTTTCGLYSIQDGKLALVADVHVEREMDFPGKY